jgi:tRNA A37 threonylcarbamoyladenosine dehydratase
LTNDSAASDNNPTESVTSHAAVFSAIVNAAAAMDSQAYRVRWLRLILLAQFWPICQCGPANSGWFGWQVRLFRRCGCLQNATSHHAAGSLGKRQPIRRLYSSDGLERLRAAHVCVIGIGGVGSWAVEALARSGIGTLTLVDMDDICVSNVNRQIHAVDGEIHKPKVETMATRIRSINPACAVNPHHMFFTAANANRILETRFDYVLDAIDAVREKALCISLCHALKLRVITSGGAGGRRDPTRIVVDDLSCATHDRLLQSVRKRLRAEHGFPRGGGKFGVECVFSPEPPLFAHKDGTVCDTKELGHAQLKLDCRSGFGSATFVTGSFGFVAAGRIVSHIAAG